MYACIWGFPIRECQIFLIFKFFHHDVFLSSLSTPLFSTLFLMGVGYQAPGRSPSTSVRFRIFTKHFLRARLGTKPWRGTYLILKLLAWRTKFIQHLGSFRYFICIITFNLHSHPLGLIMVILILHLRERRLSDDRQLAEGHLASTLPFLLSSLALIPTQMTTRTILEASE